MDHKRDKEAVLHLYNKILPPLAEKIYQNLTEVTPLFDDFHLEKVVDTWTKDRNTTSEKEISLENGNVQQMGLRLRLNGFQAAGAQTFDLSKDLVFLLEYSTYTVGPDKNTRWLEKPYLESWTSKEMEETASRWCEEIIDEITQKLQTL
ncbi:hypothetical protein ACD591_17170 [Rufibacter glacialis]|uniref:Uncharacterized protein n=1 Tax=Rufibacter glacialis TaxID=1259555 RepID=A0A5M8QE40_9BACT|nr:hypothetical protein [Rufibacter glacialis]KAA6434315.1 hypothetical protein FOE74_08905 [Rufibacter glacialis]GGK68497.1 hypothetical protein GCM10011405_15750 [Rufibacter glacialis]